MAVAAPVAAHAVAAPAAGKSQHQLQGSRSTSCRVVSTSCRAVAAPAAGQSAPAAGQSAPAAGQSAPALHIKFNQICLNFSLY